MKNISICTQTRLIKRAYVLPSVVMATVAMTLSSLSAIAALPFKASIPSFRTSSVGVETPVFRLNTSLPFVDSSVPLVATLAPDAQQQLKIVAERLGLTGIFGSNGRGQIGLRDFGGKQDQQTLTVFEASAGYTYEFDNKLHAIPNTQPNLPKNAEAYEIAVNFLNTRGLLPKDVVLDPKKVDFSHPELAQFEAKTGRILKTFTTGVEVRFEQTWGNLPVSGPGSKLYVSIGDQGEVLGLTHMGREGRATEIQLETIAPQQALKSLTTKEAQLSVPAGCSIAEINYFRMVYWSESPRISQRHAWPVYHITGQCHTATGQDLGGFEAYTAAVIEPAVYPEATPRYIDPEQDRDG